MSKVKISPLLSSLFSRTDLMTKEEADRLVERLSDVGNDDSKIVLAQSNCEQSNYLYFHGDIDDNDVVRGLEDCGFDAISSDDKGVNEGFWIYFNRQ